MKRLLSSLVVLSIVSIVAACSGPTGVDQPARLAVTATPIPPSPCDFCAFGPEAFTRTPPTGPPRAQCRSFTADPGVAYDLVIVPTGGAYSETQVIINGKKYVFDSRSGPDFRQTLLLLDQNNLCVKVFGPQGAQATVWFEAIGDPT